MSSVAFVSKRLPLRTVKLFPTQVAVFLLTSPDLHKDCTQDAYTYIEAKHTHKCKTRSLIQKLILNTKCKHLEQMVLVILNACMW